MYILRFFYLIILESSNKMLFKGHFLSFWVLGCTKCFLFFFAEPKGQTLEPLTGWNSSGQAFEGEIFKAPGRWNNLFNHQIDLF